MTPAGGSQECLSSLRCGGMKRKEMVLSVAKAWMWLGDGHYIVFLFWEGNWNKYMVLKVAEYLDMPDKEVI